MSKTIVISLPARDLAASLAFYQALGFEQNPQFSDASGAHLVWSEAIHLVLLTHAKWHSLTDRPMSPAGSARVMLMLTVPSREAVDAMNEAAAAHGGQADVNPVQDEAFMYGRDLADPDGHLWGALWMAPQAMPPAEPQGA